MSNEAFDIETLADKTVEMLRVAPGQVFWIWASSHSLDFVEALALRIRQRGAFWTLRLVIETLLRRIGQNVPEPYLGLIPNHELRWLEDIHAIIEVRDHGGTIPDVLLPRRRQMAAEWIALIDEAARQRIRHVEVVNPTLALAAAYGLPHADLRRACWQAVNVDYAEVDRQMQAVAARLIGTDQVYITSALGTDLRLRIGGRPILQDTDSLPRGEVYAAPHEDSAEGIAVIDRTFIKGKPVERLRLKFEQGRVTEIEAPASGSDDLRALLAASTGDKDVIAEFAIGLNPGVLEPLGPVTLDEKISGSVHIAIGMNERFGGKNRANLHLDLVILRPSVWLDGELVLADRVLSL